MDPIRAAPTVGRPGNTPGEMPFTPATLSRGTRTRLGHERSSPVKGPHDDCDLSDIAPEVAQAILSAGWSIATRLLTSYGDQRFFSPAATNLRSGLSHVSLRTLPRARREAASRRAS